MHSAYEILEIPNFSSATEVKKAYKALAVKWHPDKHTAESKTEQDIAAEKFKVISNAYDELSDPARKNAYDRELRAQMKDNLEKQHAQYKQPEPDRFQESSVQAQYRKQRSRFSAKVLAVFDTLIANKVLSENDIIEIPDESVAYVSHPSCLKALQAGIVWVLTHPSIPEESWEYIATRHCLDALNSRVFTLSQFEHMSVDRVKIFTAAEHVEIIKKIFKPAGFDMRDINKLSTEKLDLFFSAGWVQAVENKVCKVGDFSTLNIETLRKMTPTYINAYNVIIEHDLFGCAQRGGFMYLISNKDPKNPLADVLYKSTNLSSHIEEFRQSLQDKLNHHSISGEEAVSATKFIGALDEEKFAFFQADDPLLAAKKYTDNCLALIEAFDKKLMLSEYPLFAIMKSFSEAISFQRTPHQQLQGLRYMMQHFKSGISRDGTIQNPQVETHKSNRP